MNKTTVVTAYPLSWPVAVPRTKAGLVKRSSFGDRPWGKSLRELRKELDLLGARQVTVSTNQPVRQDGEPYAQVRRIDDAGVAVYCTLKNIQVCFPCDRFATIAENFRAITLHLSSMRGQARWGVGTAEQAFAGYKALPAAVQQEENWWEVLGVPADAPETLIQEAWRFAVKAKHPDVVGGSAEAVARINAARDRGLEARRG